MKHSESIVNIAKALAEFNKQVTRIKKDANNPFFKNSYTTLDSMLDAVRPLLAEQGISIMQFPTSCEGKIIVKTLLLHESGEYIEGEGYESTPVKNDPQAIGSAITYAKRYSLGANLGLSTGDKDDDGNAASHTEPPKQQSNQSNIKQMNNSKSSEKQQKLLHVNIGKIAKLMSMTKEDVQEKFGIVSVSELTFAECSDYISKTAKQITKLEGVAQ